MSPVDYSYDEFGEKVSMTTYRNLVGSDDPTAPQGDVTRWLRDEATGLVTNKVYADGKGPRYDYTPDGKLATRTWARGIVTTYSLTTTKAKQPDSDGFVDLSNWRKNQGILILHLRMITVEWLEPLNSMIPIIRSLVKVKTQAIQ